MATFRYIFTDWQNNLLDQLPVQGSTLTWGVSTPGTFTGQVILGDQLKGPRVRACTQPLKTKLFIERDGQLQWGGQVTEPRPYDSSSHAVTVNAQETTGYLAGVFLPTLSLLGLDQVTIAEQVVAAAQAQAGASAGLTVTPLTGLSGVLRDGAYSQSDFTDALQAVTDMTEASGGFEFATRVSWSNGVPFEEILIAYPQLGRRGAASPLVIEYNEVTGAGNCRNYTWPDGPGLATRVWGSATTADGVQLVASADNLDLLRSGYPLIESKVDFSSSKPATQADLQAYVTQQAAWADGEVTAAQFTVTPSADFRLGLFTVGDDVRVRITDEWFPAGAGGQPGFDGWMRIGQLQCTPDQSGSEVYTVTTLNYTTPEAD